jgi:flagellar biosynthesis protein FlhG
LSFSSNASQSFSQSLESLNKKYSYHGKQKIWGIGGGKGGVGKSLVSANLSILLASMGHKVVAVDLDLGGANLHTCLGIPIPSLTLSDYISKKETDINKLLVPTQVDNLYVISGAQDELGMANLKQTHKNKILQSFSQIDADYIIFDLGAGTTFNTLDFFITANQGILVVLPEPTSIENTYRFIKSVFYRRLKIIEELLDIQPIIQEAMNAKMGSPKSTPIDLIRKVESINPEIGMKLRAEIQKFRPKLIMNQVRGQQDIDIGYSIKSVCRKYFGIELDFIGYLDYDSSVWKSVKSRKPLLMEFPNSKLVGHFEKIVQRLLDN